MKWCHFNKSKKTHKYCSLIRKQSAKERTRTPVYLKSTPHVFPKRIKYER